jgi:hypothetical protein
VQYVKDAVRLAWGLVNQVCTSVVSNEPVLAACYVFVIPVPAGKALHFFSSNTNAIILKGNIRLPAPQYQETQNHTFA